MPETLIILEEIEVDTFFLKVIEEYEKTAKNVIYIGCPRPKGDEFQKLKKEGE